MTDSADIVVTRVSAITALGVNSYESAMALRAGAVGMREGALLDEAQEPITFCSVPTLGPWLEGPERLDALADICLHDLLEQAPFLVHQRAKVVLLLDEDQGEPSSQGIVPAEALGMRVRQWVRETTQSTTPLEVDVTGGGGFGDAINRLAQELRDGYFEFGLLLAAHTDYGIERIAQLSRHHRLHKAEQLDGLIPGEAAVGLLVCTAQTARTNNLIPTCAVGPAAVTMEKARWDNDHPSFEAAGLTVAARTATAPQTSAGRPIGWVQSDISAEMFRVYELQTVMTRIQKRLGPPQVLETPCQKMGHLGAASAAWQVAYAAEAFRRGFAPAAEVLCMAGSEGGARSAFVVSSPPQ